MRRCYAVKLGPLALTRRRMTIELIPENSYRVISGNMQTFLILLKYSYFSGVKNMQFYIREYFLLDHFYKEYYPLVDRFYSFLQLIKPHFLVCELHGVNRHDEGVHDIMDSSLRIFFVHEPQSPKVRSIYLILPRRVSSRIRPVSPEIFRSILVL